MRYKEGSTKTSRQCKRGELWSWTKKLPLLLGTLALIILGGTTCSDDDDDNGTCTCGDGVVDLYEMCDEGELNAEAPNRCRPNCMMPICGDGIVDDEYG